MFFLLGVLNSPVADWYFKLIAKPKDNGYFEANKQFIAPIPIPDATDARRRQVGEMAESLQKLHTERRDAVAKLQRRIDSPQCVNDSRKIDWLWADVAASQIKALAPEELTTRERTEWVQAEIARRLESYYERIDVHLRPNVELRVETDADA